MEKLIELLNEYREKELGYRVPEWEEKGNLGITNEQLISKKFGFIKWLVDNDKIDRNRILKENGQFRLFYYDLERVKNYDRLWKIYTADVKEREEENKKLKEKIEKLEKELSAVYKAYHTALGVDYVSEEDLYDLDD